jgi:hypothetical protein
MMFKKSQAALEFLTTYAWAFLVILIMIGALAYFGILSPTNLFPERCSLGSEITCVDYKLDANAGNVLLKLQNNVGESISVSEISVTNEGAVPLSCILTGIAQTITQGASSEFTVLGCATAEWNGAALTVGQKGKVDVTITYNTIKGGTGYPHEVKGEIFATVQ